MSNENKERDLMAEELKGSSDRETALGEADPNSELKGAKRWVT